MIGFSVESVPGVEIVNGINQPCRVVDAVNDQVAGFAGTHKINHYYAVRCGRRSVFIITAHTVAGADQNFFVIDKFIT